MTQERKKERKKEKRVRPFWVFECVIVYHFVSILKISFPPPLCACVYLKKKSKFPHWEKKSNFCEFKVLCYIFKNKVSLSVYCIVSLSNI